jgi:hypothetical protein
VHTSHILIPPVPSSNFGEKKKTSIATVMAVARIGLCLSPPRDTHPIFLHTVRLRLCSHVRYVPCWRARCQVLCACCQDVCVMLFGNGQDVLPSRAEHPSSGPIRRHQYPSLPKHQCFTRAFHIACVIRHHNALCHLALSRIASQCCMSQVAHADFFFSLSLSLSSTMSAMAFSPPEALIFSSSYFKWYTKRVNQQTVCMATLRAAI